MSAEPLPPGYVRSAHDGIELVSRAWAADALAFALVAHGSLYRWAEAQPEREALRGRGTAWAAVLPAGTDRDLRTAVVVRHSYHGGLFARVTGDLFVRPTRAPRELAAAARLTAAGVPTPEVVAYVIHPVAGLLARSDVMTRRLPPGRDFPDAWAADPSPLQRGAIIEAVAALLRALSRAGAHHPDLNVKNVYVAVDGDVVTAYVLDIDRVRFTDSEEAAASNFARFARSVRKWDAERSLGVGDDALVRLAALAWVEA
ncbi:MAG: phosphotransferase [Gemmatimonadaceae bacterium]|nr:phosphotransferase [Gemmatimonadaceae bacterium]